MKKSALLAFGLLLVAGSTFAQGTLNFANFAGGGTVNAPVRNAAGVLIAPGGAFAACFYGGSAGSLTNYLSIQQAFAGNGLFLGGAQQLPGFATGSDVFVQVVAWIGGTSYAAATVERGFSNVILVSGLGGGTAPAPNLTGLQTFTMAPVIVPEPATIALAGLGVASLLFLRRRK